MMTFYFWPQALRLLLRLGKDLGSAAERVLEAWLKVPFSAEKLRWTCGSGDWRVKL